MFSLKKGPLLLSFILVLLVSCEEYGKEEFGADAIRAGVALKISSDPFDDNTLNRATKICEALEQYHDNILRNVFNENFVFSRRVKNYGDAVIRDISEIIVYIDTPGDYNETPMYLARYDSMKSFSDKIPTENNLYLASICDYALNNVGTLPKYQQKVGNNYHVFSFPALDRVDVGIYSKNSNGSYYLYRKLEYLFNMNLSARYYGMAMEQSDIFIKDTRNSDFSVIYQKFERIR